MCGSQVMTSVSHRLPFFFSYTLHAVAVAASEPNQIRLFQEVID